MQVSSRGPLSELNKDSHRMGGLQSGTALSAVKKAVHNDGGGSQNADCNVHLAELLKQLKSLVDSQPSKKYPMMEDEVKLLCNVHVAEAVMRRTRGLKLS